MNDDPERVDVLYGRCIDTSGRLQKLADFVVDTLETEGLLDRQYDHVKLHATLMNSLFQVKDDAEENNIRSTFNAKPILEVHTLLSFSFHLMFEKLTNYFDFVKRIGKIIVLDRWLSIVYIYRKDTRRPNRMDIT